MADFATLYGPRLNLWLNNSDSNVLFTTARRQQAINDAQAQFCDLTECLKRESTVTVSCNTVEYNLLSSAILTGSSNFARLAKQGPEYKRYSSAGTVMDWLTGDDFLQRPIEWRNRQESGWRNSTTPTTPTGWYLRSNDGGLFFGLDQPPLVSSAQSAEIVVPFVQRPATLSNSTDVPFTVNGAARTDLTIFHEALPHYAAYTLLPLTGDDAGAQTHLQRFLDYVARYLGQQTPRGGSYVQFGVNYLQRARGRRFGYRGSVPPSQFS